MQILQLVYTCKKTSGFLLAAAATLKAMLVLSLSKSTMQQAGWEYVGECWRDYR